MNATQTLTQMGNQWNKTEKFKYPHTIGVCDVGYRRQKQMSETKEEENLLAADVKQIVAAMLGGFGIESKAGAAADNTAEAEERKGKR